MPRRRKIALERRGNGYRARIQIGKHRHSITLPTGDRRIAAALAAKRIEELERSAERKLAGQVTGLRMSELVERFVQDELPLLSRGAREAYEDSLKPIRTYFTEIGDPAVDSVQTRHIKDFLSWRRVNPHRRRADATDQPTVGPLSNRTLQKDRAVLHRIFAVAERQEYRDGGNPVGRAERPKADPRDPVILTDTQYHALLDRMQPVARCSRSFVLVLGEAGLRCESEALWLRWEDVRLDEGAIRVTSGREGHRTKSGKSRHVPMTPRLVAGARVHFARHRFDQYDGKPTPWVFHHEITRCHHVAGERIKSLHSAFRSAGHRAGLPAELDQHDMRHRRVTTWLAAGKPPVAVMQAMGHSDLKTTMSYYKLRARSPARSGERGCGSREAR